MDIYAWHRQVLELLEQKDSETLQKGGLGRMWERLASEIFLANADAPVWGWADEASSWLMDFWLDFDPRLNFLLLFTRAETVVAAHLEQLEVQELTFEQLLEAWRQRHEAMLRFGLRHSGRCLMLDAGYALAQPQVLVERLNAKWRVYLEPADVQAPVLPQSSVMARLLASQLLSNYPEVEALQNEITTSLVQQGDSDAIALALEPEELIVSYRALLGRSKEQEQINLLQEQLSLLQEQQVVAHELQGDKFARLEEELRHAQERVMTQERTLQILETKLNDSVEENELFLLQLHQAQEEQELAIVRHEELKRANARQQHALEAQLAQALKQRDDQITGVSKLQIQLEQLGKERDEQRVRVVEALEQKIQEGTEENELLLLQLHQVQEELEALFLRSEKEQKAGIAKQKELQVQLANVVERNDEYVAEVGKHQSRIEQLVKERDQLGKLIGELKAELEGRITEEQQVIKGLEQRFKEGAGENELLLLQLHQMQEELEYYLLHSQELQNKHVALGARLRKMQECYPDYVEFSAAEIVEATSASVTWKLADLTLLGKEFKELSVVTVIEHGMAGFIFSREENVSQNFLNRWPVEQANLTLLPLGTPAQVEERTSALLALGSSEWKRLLALTDFLISLLEKQSQAFKAREGFLPGVWLDGLRTLKADLTQFPPVPRFDKLKLKRHQVNPDYEHMWLAFENLSIGELSAPHFEFRVSCANVRPGAFGQFPKLEFPEGSAQTLLDSWFEESCDDFGAKLELRYALPDAMDLGVWHKLSKKDQNTLHTLIRHLPNWLRRLEKDDGGLNRSWPDWQALVSDVQRITQLHAATTTDKRGTGSSRTFPARISEISGREKSYQKAPRVDPVIALLESSPKLQGRAPPLLLDVGGVIKPKVLKHKGEVASISGSQRKRKAKR
jgi:hypothetical protein